MKKRIALAAVAALAGGLLVAAPASAVTTATTSFGFGPAIVTASGNQTATVTGTQYSGANNYANVASAATGQTWASGTNEGYLTVSGGSFITNGLVGATLDAAKTTATLTADSVTAVNVNVATPVNGTIVIKYIQRTWVSGIATDTTIQTLTLTVSTAPAAAAYNHTVIDAIDLSEANVATYQSGATTYAYKGNVATGASWDNYVGWWDYNQYSSADTSTLANDGLAKPVVVTLTGPGLIEGWSNNTGWTAGSYIVLSGDASSSFQIYADGRTGTSTVSVSVNGVAVASYTIVFFGDVATFTASISSANIAVGDTAVVTVVAKDASGILVPDALANHSADSATVGMTIYEYTAGTETFTVTAAAKAAATVTVGNYLVDTKTVVANFVTAGVASVSLAADKATYGPGEKATFTITAKNSDGVAAGDNASYSLATSGSAALYGFPTTVAVKDGVGTFSAYMPVVQGPVVVTASLAGSTTGSVSVAVVDAAAVAQAAAIVALQTSVATLTTTVASLVASMTAQIKVINATMLKIQKALAALRLQVKKLK